MCLQGVFFQEEESFNLQITCWKQTSSFLFLAFYMLGGESEQSGVVPEQAMNEIIATDFCKPTRHSIVT